MNGPEHIEQRLTRMEAIAQELLQTCYETRKLIREASVSTPAKDQPLSEQELAAISARRRKRLLRHK